MNSRERFFTAVKGGAPDGIPLVPISMMIAADTIGESYRAYATDYRVLSRGQIAFAEKFDIDHVSVISDPATEAADCGAAIRISDHQPPDLDERQSLLIEKSVLKGLRVPDPSTSPRMSNRVRGVEELKRTVGSAKIVEGWVEGPIAEASDLRGINRFMIDLLDDPAFVTDLLEFGYELAIVYAEAQVKAGADIIGIGDAASSLIGPELFEEFALPYQRRYVDKIHEMGALTRLHICGNSQPAFPHLSTIRTDLMDLDWIAPVAKARRESGPDQVLTGNIDPVRVLKDGTPESVYAAVGQCFTDAGTTRYMVAAGCEIPRDTPDENIRAMTRFARDHRYGDVISE